MNMPGLLVSILYIIRVSKKLLATMLKCIDSSINTTYTEWQWNAKSFVLKLNTGSCNRQTVIFDCIK